MNISSRNRHRKRGQALVVLFAATAALAGGAQALSPAPAAADIALGNGCTIDAWFTITCGEQNNGGGTDTDTGGGSCPDNPGGECTGDPCPDAGQCTGECTCVVKTTCTCDGAASTSCVCAAAYPDCNCGEPWREPNAEERTKRRSEMEIGDPYAAREFQVWQENRRVRICGGLKLSDAFGGGRRAKIVRRTWRIFDCDELYSSGD